MYSIRKAFGTYLHSSRPGSETKPVSVVAWDGGSTFTKTLLATVTDDGSVDVKYRQTSTSLSFFAKRPILTPDESKRLHFIVLSSINEAGGDHESIWAEPMDKVSNVIMIKKERELDGNRPGDIDCMKKKMMVAGNHPDYIKTDAEEDSFNHPAFPLAIGAKDNGLYGLGKDRYFRKTSIKELQDNGDIGAGTTLCSYEFLYGATTRYQAKRLLSNTAGPALVVFGIPTWATYAERFDFYYKIYSVAFKGLGHCFVGIPETDATLMAAAKRMTSSGELAVIDCGGEYTMIVTAHVTISIVDGRRRVIVRVRKRASLPFGQTSVMQWALSQCKVDESQDFIKRHLEEILLKMAHVLPDLFQEEEYGMLSTDVNLGFLHMGLDNHMITRVRTEWAVNSARMFLANLFGILHEEKMVNADVYRDNMLHIQFVGKTSSQVWFQNVAKSFLSQLPPGYLPSYRVMFDDCMTTTGLLIVPRATTC